jgi:hypothetical protein
VALDAGATEIGRIPPSQEAHNSGSPVARTLRPLGRKRPHTGRDEEWFSMMFLWIPFVFVVLFAMWWLVRPAGLGMGGGMGSSMPASMQGPPPAPHGDPVEIVRQRLARGEITPEEYETVRRALG